MVPNAAQPRAMVCFGFDQGCSDSSLNRQNLFAYGYFYVNWRVFPVHAAMTTPFGMPDRQTIYANEHDVRVSCLIVIVLDSIRFCCGGEIIPQSRWAGKSPKGQQSRGDSYVWFGPGFRSIHRLVRSLSDENWFWSSLQLLNTSDHEANRTMSRGPRFANAASEHFCV